MNAPVDALPGWPAPDVPGPVRRPWAWQRAIMMIGLGQGSGIGLCWLLTVTHQWRVTPQSSALSRLNPGLLVSSAVVLAGALALAALLSRAARDWARALRAGIAARPPARPSVLPRDGVVLFTGSSMPAFRLCFMLLSGAVVITGSAVLVRTPLLPVALALAVAGRLARTRVRVWAGPGGVSVGSLFRRRLFHTPLPAIRSVKTVYLLLADSGGPVLGGMPLRAWGYRRGGLAFARVLRDGPALVLELPDGRLAVCSLPDAARAASLIAGLAGLGPAGPGAAAPGGPAVPTAPTDRSSAAPAGLDSWTAEQVRAELRRGRKIAAVALVHTRARPRMDLRSARLAVEAIAGEAAAGEDSSR